jgi:hypothetical protein
MPVKILLAAAAALFLQSATAWSAQPTWDVSKNFSSTRNPNGPWKYYGNGTLLNVSGDPCGTVDKSGCPAWSNGLIEPGAVYMTANNTGSTLSFYPGLEIPPGYVQINPQSGYGIVSWTVPEAGTYTFAGAFERIAQAGAARYVHIDLLGTQAPLFDGSVSPGQSAPFSVQMSLLKGQIFNFVVLSSSNLAALSTGLSLQIKLLPAN